MGLLAHLPLFDPCRVTLDCDADVVVPWPACGSGTEIIEKYTDTVGGGGGSRSAMRHCKQISY
jgi:hypothetical protein